MSVVWLHLVYSLRNIMAILHKPGLCAGLLLIVQLGQLVCEPASPGQPDDLFVPYEGQRYDTFDWEILKQLDTPDSGNVVISPLSVKLLMAILYEGILPSSTTALEMEAVLNFPSNISHIRDRYTTILNSLQAPSKTYDLNIESKLYLDSSYTFQDSFVGRIGRYYKAGVEKTNFNNSADTSTKINEWVSKVTEGKITNMISEDDVNQAVLLLLNAVYFKGNWLSQFPRNETTKGGFYLSSQQSVTVDYMRNTGKYYYIESSDLDAKILRIPYKEKNIAMFIVLPNSKAGLKRLIKHMSPGVLNKHLWLMDQVSVEVILPKFKIDFKSKLGRVMQKMGLQKIFENTANFGRMVKGGKGRIFVSNILQKAGIEVNEEGSTAYAASGIILGNKFGVPDFIFNASNPFLFYIEDTRTGSILFSGKIENPVQEEPAPFPADLEVPSRYGTPSSEVAVAPLSVPSQVTGFQMSLNPTDVKNNNLLDYGKFHYFDMELLKAVVSRNNGNILVSPTSVKQVLAMVLEGADGQCADELRNALRLPHDQRQIRNLFGNLLTELQDDEPGVTFEVANHIFISNKVSPNVQYQEHLQKFYHSGIKTVDFSSPSPTANLINDWISKITHGLIPALLTADSINPETSIILANALFFKGLWEKSFNEERTRASCFQHPSHECYKTNMMDTTDTFKYAYIKELDAKAVELPYKGNKYSMLIVLPNKMNGMTRLLRDLPYEYDKLVSKLEYQEVLLSIPRFSFEYSEDIARNLEEVEITAIFSEQRANLSHIVNGKNNLFISNVFHKAKIEVNEKGTVAAASTGAVVIPLMGSTKPRFRADHPFVFFIRHIELGIILFAGRVSEPELAEPLGGNKAENRGDSSQKAYFPEVPVYTKSQQRVQPQEFKAQEQYNNQQAAYAAQQARQQAQQAQAQRVQYTPPQNQNQASGSQYSQSVQQPQRTQYTQNQYSQNAPQTNQPNYQYQNENDGFIFPKKN